MVGLSLVKLIKKLSVTYLFVQLDEDGLEELIQVCSLMVGVLHVTQTLAHVGLIRQEDLLHLLGERVQGHIYVFSVSNFF